MAIERLPPKPGAWTVTKRHVVAGHITRALRLFVLEDDPLSAHVLCGAARDIMHELAKAEGKDLVWNLLSDIIKEDKKREFFGLLKDEYNFLKHADPQREATMTHYTPDLTAMFLWEACVNCQVLFGRNFTETTAFEVWFLSWHPGIAKDDYAKKLGRLRFTAPNFYDADGRMSWDALRQAFKLFQNDNAKPNGMSYLAAERAVAPK